MNAKPLLLSLLLVGCTSAVNDPAPPAWDAWDSDLVESLDLDVGLPARPIDVSIMVIDAELVPLTVPGSPVDGAVRFEDVELTTDVRETTRTHFPAAAWATLEARHDPAFRWFATRVGLYDGNGIRVGSVEVRESVFGTSESWLDSLDRVIDIHDHVTEHEQLDAGEALYLYEAGLMVRSKIRGDEWVDGPMAAREIDFYEAAYPWRLVARKRVWFLSSGIDGEGIAGEDWFAVNANGVESPLPVAEGSADAP